MMTDNIHPEMIEKLVTAAFTARQKSYAPYSGFQVGAALLGQNGLIYSGCNVENASYGATICAEQTALVKAVSEGTRSFSAIAVAAETADGRVPTPCGLCRQILAEFNPEMMVVMVSTSGRQETTTLDRLLPAHFTLRHQ
jgi:cytidine deaminase